MINYKAILYVTEPFHGMFRKTFWKFFKVDALFIFSLYLIQLFIGLLLKIISDDIQSLVSFFVFSLLLLVAYTFFKSVQYRHMEKNHKYHELLGKHLTLALILIVILFLIRLMLSMFIGYVIKSEYIATAFDIISIGFAFYIYLVFINTHNHDHHSSFKAIIKSFKSLTFKKIIKIIYFDAIYFVLIYLIHGFFTIMFQLLLVKVGVSQDILNMIFVVLDYSLRIILIIAILSMNKIIIYKIEEESVLPFVNKMTKKINIGSKKGKKKKSTKKSNTKRSNQKSGKKN